VRKQPLRVRIEYRLPPVMSLSVQRLPSLHNSAVAFRNEVDAATPGIVLTATARYRNDPYRIDVRVPFVPPRHQSDSCHPPVAVAPVATFEVVQPATVFPPKPLRGARHTLPALPPQMDSRRHPRESNAVAVAKSTTTDVDQPSTPDRKVALIKFKRTQLSAYYDPVAIPGMTQGSIVIVQGDRGEHIATVVSTHLTRPRSSPTTIIRLATASDLEQYRRVQEDEALALETCRAHSTRLGLDEVMHIADVEFQFDFQKLTIFFQAMQQGTFVDFRNLQRTLYQHFRCRIWIVDC
jgi:hypothetical protein